MSSNKDCAKPMIVDDGPAEDVLEAKGNFFDALDRMGLSESEYLMARVVATTSVEASRMLVAEACLKERQSWAMELAAEAAVKKIMDREKSITKGMRYLRQVVSLYDKLQESSGAGLKLGESDTAGKWVGRMMGSMIEEIRGFCDAIEEGR